MATTEGQRQAWLVLAAMSLPLLALSIDMNGVGTVLEPIQADLGVSDASLGWIVNANALTFAATLIIVGRLAPRLGERRLVLAGVAVFGLASIVCGAAPSLGVLLAGRVAQGLGGVMTFTTSLAVIDRVFDEEHRPAAIGFWGTVNGAGGAIGPLVGGAMATWWSWRGFFYLNVPLCLIGLPIIARLTPADPAPGAEAGAPLPWARLVALSAGMVALTAGFQASARAGWGSALTLALLAAGAALLAGSAVVHRRGGLPVVSRDVTGSPFFRVASVAAFSSNWGFGVAIVFMGTYLQQVAGLTPLAAGLVFSAFSTACALAGLLIGRLTRRLGLVRALDAGLAVVVVSMAAGALLTDSTPLAVVALGLAAAGFGQGLAFDLSTLAALHGVPQPASGEASAVVSTVRALGLTIGVALSTTVSLSVAGGTSDAEVTRGIAAAFALAAVVAGVGLVAVWRGGGRVAPDARPAEAAPVR